MILTVKKISDFVQVDLKVGNFNVKLQVLLHRVDMVENIVNNSGYNALFVRVVDDALHGVSLATGGLAIRKYRPVVTTKYI